ncbi:MAG TPA: type II secretion system F family protein [Chloroflexota bacterium]|nr:type II secretion system F family protein [Chloroflexota bacterium]
MLILVILLIMIGLGVAYTLRSALGGNPMLISTRMGRYGLIIPADGDATGSAAVAVSTIVAPDRPRQQHGAVSQQLERVVGNTGFAKKIQRRLDRAQLKFTAAEWLAMCFAVFVVAVAIGLFIRGGLGALVGGVAGLVVPWVYLKRRITRRGRRFLEQLADATQMMGNSMRSGFSILQAMELVANESAPPVCEEFERVVTEVKLGLPIELALDHMLERMPSEDLGLLVVAISVQRQIGGNLAEILNIISKTIRDRVRFARDLRTLTAQARISSYIITGLPVAVGVAINFLDRSYEQMLYTTLLGNFMLGAAVIMLALGFFFLSRIANIEV